MDLARHKPAAFSVLQQRLTLSFIFLRSVAPLFFLHALCSFLFYSVLCLCRSGGGSEWDTEGAFGSPAVPAVPLSCVWSSELAELIMDWFKVCQHKPRGPETAPCAAHTPVISIAHSHTGIKLCCVHMHTKGRARKMDIVKRGSSEALAERPVCRLYLPAVMFSI